MGWEGGLGVNLGERGQEGNARDGREGFIGLRFAAASWVGGWVRVSGAGEGGRD